MASWEKKRADRSRVSTHHFSESRNNFAQSGEGLVDVGSLLESCALRSCGVGSLAASQIHQTDLAHLASKNTTLSISSLDRPTYLASKNSLNLIHQVVLLSSRQN